MLFCKGYFLPVRNPPISCSLLITKNVSISLSRSAYFLAGLQHTRRSRTMKETKTREIEWFHQSSTPIRKSSSPDSCAPNYASFCLIWYLSSFCCNYECRKGAPDEITRAVLRNCRGRWASVPQVVICKNQEQRIISEAENIGVWGSQCSEQQKRKRWICFKQAYYCWGQGGGEEMIRKGREHIGKQTGKGEEWHAGLTPHRGQTAVKSPMQRGRSSWSGWFCPQCLQAWHCFLLILYSPLPIQHEGTKLPEQTEPTK